MKNKYLRRTDFFGRAYYANLVEGFSNLHVSMRAIF